MIYLICKTNESIDGSKDEGHIIDVIRAPSSEEAYENSIACNYGEILIEVDEPALRKILEANVIRLKESTKNYIKILRRGNERQI